MSGSPSGGRDAVSDGKGVWLNQTPVTATHLAPPHVPCPRAWERVSVVPATSQSRPRKIWKRVAGPHLGTRDSQYLGALAELESQGAGSRKRARRKGHIPVWGEGPWNVGVELPRTGKEDLIEARDLVSTAETESSKVLPVQSASRHATFPEDKLRWVPRKRHNTRWPIQPTATASRMIAALQPLVEFQVPREAEPVDTTRQVGGQAMEKRSTRRLSRRLSLFPGDQSPGKISAVRLSPVKMTAPVMSPLKRPPVTLSPVKVAESPYRSFSVNATPNKVVLKSPKPSLPAESPLKPSPAPTARSSLGASTNVVTLKPASPTTDACPLLFDQPISDAIAEPEYETRRRRSLQNARHSDRRRSSGVTRLLRFDDAVQAPNRRHSFSLTRSIVGDAKSRRVTLDVCSDFSFEGLDVQSFSDAGSRRSTLSGCEDSKASVGTDATYSVVKVDAGTTLDIFSPQRKANSNILPSAAAIKLSSPFPMKGVPDTVHGTPSGERRADQAATSPSQDAAEDDWHDKQDMENDIPVQDSTVSTTDSDQAGLDADSANPEGLSTIYEESFVTDRSESETQAVAAVIMQDAERASSPCSEQDDAMQLEAMHTRQSPVLSRHAPSVASEGYASPEIPVPGPVAAADVLSCSDSPTISCSQGPDLSLEPSTSLSPSRRSARDSASPSRSQESVATPDDDVCVSTAASEIPTDVDDDRAQLLLSPQVPELPGTPRSANTTSTEGVIDAAQGSPASSESSGFTPINGRQISPPQASSAFDAASESDSGDEQQPDDEDEMMEAIDEDEMTLTVVAPHIENDTLSLQVSHDDSETEMLRQFVTRVAADKSAKAAAAADALSKKSSRPKRRSGSTGSTTSTGSPMTKSDTPLKRTPLGERSANSPSPVKKRKLEDDDCLGKPEFEILEVTEESTDAPKLKRRRKRADPVLDAAPEGVSLDECQSYFTSAEPGPRRSTRSRNTRVALKPTAPSANSIALSTISVRLPGMADDTMESHLAALKSRSEEKDMAAVTRVNTRKNKGNSVYPKVVLARQMEDPSWRMKELKGVFDAKESRAAEAADGRKSRKAKGVRWAEELVRFQGDEKPSAFKSLASSLLADIMMEGPAQDVDELAPQPEPTAGEAAAKPEARENPVATPVKRALPRRTRSSKLQAPTPVNKVMEKTTPPPAQPVRRTALPKATVSTTTPPAAAAATTTSSAGAKVGMATRRSKIAKLGMGVNGTPAPKRRGRTAL